MELRLKTTKKHPFYFISLSEKEFDNTEAQYELELFINKILSFNDVELFLFRLDREDSLRVSNLFSKYLLENFNEYHIEELIEGKTKLEVNQINQLKLIINQFDKNLIELK